MGKDNFRFMEHFIIYKDENGYCAFPDVERLNSGEIVVIFRKAPKRRIPTHLDSESKAVLVRSKDPYHTWGEEITVYDDEFGIQDPSVAVLKDGTIISNFFKWKVVKEEPFDHYVVGTFIALGLQENIQMGLGAILFMPWPEQNPTGFTTFTLIQIFFTILPMGRFHLVISSAPAEGLNRQDKKTSHGNAGAGLIRACSCTCHKSPLRLVVFE